MQKIIFVLFWVALILWSTFPTQIKGGSQYDECRFLYSEIQRYEYKLSKARDRYEYDRYMFTLKKYKYNYNKYCRQPQPNRNPFRGQQQQQSGGYLGY